MSRSAAIRPGTPRGDLRPGPAQTSMRYVLVSLWARSVLRQATGPDQRKCPGGSRGWDDGA